MQRSFLLLFGLYLVATLTATGSTTFLKGRKMFHEVAKVSQADEDGAADYAGTSASVAPRAITVRPLYISRRSTSTIRPSGDTLRQVGRRRPSIATASPSDNWAADDADTCGGSISVPLASDRISLFESSQFLEGRDYPLLCTWNVKASKSCGLARITMRLDGRSRLPDVKECANGHYAVHPFMQQVKICGRIGDVPPLQWYVDIDRPENVTIVMHDIGMNDGNPEGLSFTLQGECIDDESDEDIAHVGKENDRLRRRWMKRLVEDFERGEGPRMVKLENAQRRRTALPLKKFQATTEATQQSITTAKRRPISYDDHSGIPWLILKSPDKPDAHQMRPTGSSTAHNTN